MILYLYIVVVFVLLPLIHAYLIKKIFCTVTTVLQ